MKIFDPSWARNRRNQPYGLLSLATLVCLFVITAAGAQHSQSIEARVSKVIDGDTFTLKGVSRRIRVWGLDAPEWDHRGGTEATATMRQLISGKSLHCELQDIDRYGRLVMRCALPDGRDIAAEMIRRGVATEYCRYSGGYYGTC